jgi:hypothetical protein
MIKQSPALLYLASIDRSLRTIKFVVMAWAVIAFVAFSEARG